MGGTVPIVALASKYREIFMTYDSLPPDFRESYADGLLKLAAPYQPAKPHQEQTQSKAKSSSE